jgi:hypothetical protein
VVSKLWLASDAEGILGITGLHLFVGDRQPTFNQGGSQGGDDCEYLGEVLAASVRGVHPKPGTSVEAVLLLKGGE